MKLQATFLPRVRRLVPSAERGLSVALIGFLGAIEFAGYHATTEFHDALAGTALVAVAMFVAAYHRSRPLGWVEVLQDRLTRGFERFSQLKYDVGVDFRGEPPLPRKLPRVVPISFIGVVIWIAVGFTAWYYYPNGWRDLGVHTSYVLYVMLLMVLWSLLFACIAGGVLLPVAVLDQRLRAASGDQGQGPPDAVVVAGYALLAILVACVTPPVYGASFALLVVLAGLAGSLRARRDDSAVLWRNGPTAIFAVPLRRLVMLSLALAGLFVVGLVVWACGGRLFAAPTLEAGMPVTIFLGTLAAWLVPGMAAVLVYQWLDFRRSDPARRQPPIVHVDAGYAAAWNAIQRWGFHVAAPAARTRDHVGLRLVRESDSEAAEFDPQWPLKVSLADLDGTLVKERVARRDELQLRRQFFKALATVVKKAKAAAPTRGGGFFIAPQYWFITGVLWADPDHGPAADEDTLRPLGPPYRRLMPARSRQYLHKVLRATQIDAIYLEDGVGHRKLEKVLRAVLELYDVHGGRRRAEDHHFQGIPKIRVVIHEYAPGKPFHLEDYPEPKFDDVSRSRVLHIFKDRGEEEAEIEAPFDFSWEPSPLAVY